MDDLESQRAVLDVLDAVISGYRYPSGALHNTLRGQGLVYEVHAYHVQKILVVF